MGKRGPLSSQTPVLALAFRTEEGGASGLRNSPYDAITIGSRAGGPFPIINFKTMLEITKFARSVAIVA